MTMNIDRRTTVHLDMSGKDLQVTVETEDGKLHGTNPGDILAWYVSQAAPDLLAQAAVMFQRSTQAAKPSEIIEVVEK